MTKLTGKVLVQGTTFSAISTLFTEVGNLAGTTGLTINGDGANTTPGYIYAAEYEAFAFDNYTLTTTPYWMPWQSSTSSPGGNLTINTGNGHILGFSPSWAISAITQQNLVQFAGMGSQGPDVSYLEFVASDVTVPVTNPTQLPIIQVGIETGEYLYSGNVADPRPHYQAYYTSNGTMVVYENGAQNTYLGGYETYTSDDVIGVVLWRDGTGSTGINWFKNGVYQAATMINVDLTQERARVNIGQMAVGYPYGRQPYTPPIYSMITFSSQNAPTYTGNTYIYDNDYINFFYTLGTIGTYTKTSSEFATGTTATYLNNNQSVTYPPATAPWPHVVDISPQTNLPGYAVIYEIQSVPGSNGFDATMLNRVGFTATGVDQFFDADYGGGDGNYNQGDTVGLMLVKDDAGVETTAYWFVNGQLRTSQTTADFGAFTLYIEFGPNVYRPQPT